jgi:Uma2 family endonuclease
MAASPTLEQRYTPEDLLAMEDGPNYELVDGQLVEKPVSRLSIATTSGVLAEWHRFGRASGAGEAYGPELMVRAFPWAPGMIRRPDVACVSADRIPEGDWGILDIAPDWVCEAVSRNDTAYEVRAKAEMWVRAGVRLVWVAYPESRAIDVYQPGRSLRGFGPGDEITGEDVFPGFRARVDTLFPEPLPTVEPTT